MSLQQAYLRFLASPSAAALSSSPSMHFITTLVTVNSAESITKYLSRESTQLKKRVEKPLSAIETADSLVLEMETEIEFLSSGGNYLPALDDNFLSDQVVMVPIVHIVNFEDGLIKQVRLYWDQSCLLKQIGVIGRNGRNWPIKDGRDQCKLVVSSVLSTTNAPGAAPATPANGNSNGNSVRASLRKSSTSSNASSTHPTRDPHRSLSLFTPQEEEEVERVRGPNVTPRSSAKPPSRDFNEIIGANEHGEPLEPHPHENHVAGKGRNGFSAQRTFEIGSNEEKTPKGKDRTVILDPKRYQHFEFSDEHVASPPSAPASVTKQSKHSSSWDFKDFTTPEKIPLKHRKDDERHFGWSDDEKDPEPIKLPKKLNPRKDAETHFEIADNSPAGPRVRKEFSMNRKAVNNNMASHWGENESPGGGFFDNFGKEQQQSGINIAGDGIGTRKKQGREWDFDEEVPDEREEKVVLPSRTARSQTQSSAGSNYWDQNY